MVEAGRARILCVDDEVKNLKLLEAILSSQGYEIVFAYDGQETLEKLSKERFDLVILDLLMPNMDGFETCRRIRQSQFAKGVPIIIVTVLSDYDSRIRCLEAGANDFLTKPIDAAEVILRVRNLLKVKEYELFLKEYNERLETQLAERTMELKQAYINTVSILTKIAAYKDEETANHLKRVSQYCRLMASHLSFSSEEIERIALASMAHDVGKVAIPSEILLKGGSLSKEEFELMKTHTTIGANILRSSTILMFQVAERIALTHHENWDGTGYPQGLHGEQIPIEGRIMKIADVYDALRNRRPYKPELDHETAFRIILEGDKKSSPSHFDPNILKIFEMHHLEFSQIYEQFK
ncbi:HD domain-containing phosphohydrolase [Pseudothermotoga sp.]|uniref:HD domain-containing phosphohydrolase n=1 Tax=Pseudothermotoga sp. TaxID=2033661 RepID=UPI0031F63C03